MLIIAAPVPLTSPLDTLIELKSSPLIPEAEKSDVDTLFAVVPRDNERYITRILIIVDGLTNISLL